MTDWYVVWVRTGQEEAILQMCEKMIGESGAYQEIFLPKYEKAWKKKEKWEKKEEILFPGYLFFVADDPILLLCELQKIPDFTKVLGSENGPVALHESEVAFLKKYTDQDRILRMSTGDLLGGELIITDGPLKEYHGRVTHIDRRKREATLEIEFMGRSTQVKVGLEIVRKT